jgi:hypothetical protein
MTIPLARPNSLTNAGEHQAPAQVAPSPRGRSVDQARWEPDRTVPDVLAPERGQHESSSPDDHADQRP